MVILSHTPAPIGGGNTSRPSSLIAELTHRCPLHCIYCSNPLELTKRDSELTSEEWLRVFREARILGVRHLHLTGGEPLVRRDPRLHLAGARGIVAGGSGVLADRTFLNEIDISAPRQVAPALSMAGAGS